MTLTKSKKTFRLTTPSDPSNARLGTQLTTGVGKYDPKANGIWYGGCLLVVRHFSLAEAEKVMAEATEADRNVRHPSRGNVKMLAQDMEKGQFDFPCSSFLAFDTDGILIDGQSRLTAQMVSKTDQTYVCVYFVENALHFDTGAKRTARQVFKKQTGKDLPSVTPLAMAVIVDAEIGSPLSALRKGHSYSDFRPSMQDMIEYATGDATVQHCAMWAKKQKCASPLAFAWAYYDALTRSGCTEDAHGFFQDIANGETFPKTMGHVVYTRLFEAKHTPHESIPSQDQAAFMVKCWNKHLMGEYAIKIQMRAHGGRAWSTDTFPRALTLRERGL